MNLYDEAHATYDAEHQEADRERAYRKSEEWHFREITLPTVEIPERGLADWFEDGLAEIFDAKTRDHAMDSNF